MILADKVRAAVVRRRLAAVAATVPAPVRVVAAALLGAVVALVLVGWVYALVALSLLRALRRA